MGDVQCAGRHGRGRDDAGARLVDHRRGVLGQAGVAHQDGDQGARRGGADRLGQHQVRRGVVFGQQHLLSVGQVAADRLLRVFRRPGQGEGPETLYVEGRRADQDRAAGACGRTVSNAFNEMGRRNPRSPPRRRTHCASATTPCSRSSAPKANSAAPNTEKRPVQRPIQETDVGGLMGRFSVGLIVDREEGDRAVEGVVEAVSVVDPAPEAKDNGDQGAGRQGPRRRHRGQPPRPHQARPSGARSSIRIRNWDILKLLACDGRPLNRVFLGGGGGPAGGGGGGGAGGGGVM